jgi:hypothetical protein
MSAATISDLPKDMVQRAACCCGERGLKARWSDSRGARVVTQPTLPNPNVGIKTGKPSQPTIWAWLRRVFGR